MSKIYEQAWDEVSREHEFICVCGKLCTGLHESTCRKFKDKVLKRCEELKNEARNSKA